MTRGDTARRVIAGGLGVVALGCIFLGTRESSGATADAGTEVAAAVPDSPVFSPRRLPQLFVDAVGANALQASVDELTAGTDSCVRVDVAGRGTVAHKGDTTSVVPASTQKLLTAAGALGVLGPEFRFTTSAVSAGAPADGALDRLWLVGGGDPLLSTPEWTAREAGEYEYAGLTTNFTPLSQLADAIVAKGVRAIPGGIVGDGSRYTTPQFLPVWPEADHTQVGPLGALVVDDGFDLTTETLVPDPALAAAATLSAMLTARGVAVGPPSTGTAPPTPTEVATLQSAPLSDVATELLSASDNATAEGLALAVGHETSGSGTTAAGLAGIMSWLTGAGVDLTDVALVDGSGLSHDNRVTCNALFQTLELGTRPRLRAIVDGLSIAAKRGTLADRFGGTSLADRFFAKSGTLTGSAGLAGLFDPAGGTGTPRFAGVFNGGFSRPDGYTLTDALAEAVAAYPQSPPADQLVPPP